MSKLKGIHCFFYLITFLLSISSFNVNAAITAPEGTYLENLSYISPYLDHDYNLRGSFADKALMFAACEEFLSQFPEDRKCNFSLVVGKPDYIYGVWSDSVKEPGFYRFYSVKLYYEPDECGTGRTDIIGCPEQCKCSEYELADGTCESKEENPILEKLPDNIARFHLYGEVTEDPMCYIEVQAEEACPNNPLNHETSQVMEGNPVECLSGTKVERTSIYEGLGSDPLNFNLTYSSQEQIKSTARAEFLSTLKGRTFSHDRRLSVVRNSDNLKIIKIHSGEQRGQIYWSYGENQLQALNDSNLSVDLTADGFTYKNRLGITNTFNTSGQLLRREMPDGKFRQYTYYDAGNGANQLARIENTFGLRLELFYNDVNLLDRLIDPMGRAYYFEYDINKNLTHITYPDDSPSDLSNNPIKQFLFEDERFPNALTGIVDENATLFAQWQYDDNGRVISSEHADNIERIEFNYDTPGQTLVTKFIDAEKSFQYIYHYSEHGDAKAVDKIERRACTGCTVQNTTYTYNDAGRVIKKVEGDQVTEYTYDARGRELSRVEASGTYLEKVTTTEWHDDFNVPTAIANDAQRVDYTYNNNGLLIQQSISDLTSAESQVTSYEYGNYGLLTRIDGPRNDVKDTISLRYDDAGNLIASENALGHKTLFTYNNEGRVVSSTQANGLLLQLRYTPRGDIASYQYGSRKTNYVYDDARLLTKVSHSSGEFFEYEYDEGYRLVAITNNTGERIAFKHDKAGNVIHQGIYDASDNLAYQQQQRYNALNQLQQTRGNDGQITTMDYDASGNLISIEDPLGFKTVQMLDPLNQVTEIEDALGGKTSLRYNTQGLLTSFIDAENRETQYQYDGFGHVTSTQSPDTGTSDYAFDRADNLVSATDANGINVVYQYDALSRLVGIDYPNDSDVTLSYDASDNSVGRLSSITNENFTQRYEYADTGEIITLTNKIANKNYQTQYDYDDLSGRLIGMTTPLGNELSYTYNQQGQITQVILNGQSIALVFDYAPFGPVTKLIRRNGLELSQTFDLDYRLIQKNDDLLQNTSLSYDKRNNIATIASSINNGYTEFQYDALSHLSTATSNTQQQTFAYNLIGDRVAETHAIENSLAACEQTPSETDCAEATPWLNWAIDSLTLDSSQTVNYMGDFTFSFDEEHKMPYVTTDGDAQTAIVIDEANTVDYDSFTLSAWIRTEDAGTGYRGIIVKPNAFGLYLYNNQLAAYDYKNGKAHITTDALNDGEWHHIAMVKQPGVSATMQLYVDGQSVYEASGYAINSQSFPVIIGSSNSNADKQNFSGDIANVKITDRVLSEDLIYGIDFDSFTVSAWIKTDDAGSGYQGIIVKPDAFGLYLYNNSLAAYDYKNKKNHITAYPLNDGQWHHVAMTKEPGDPAKMTLYLDGQPVYQTNSYAINSQNFDLLIGASSSSASAAKFNGAIESVVTVDMVLSDALIENSFNAENRQAISMQSESALVDASGNLLKDGSNTYIYNDAGRLAASINSKGLLTEYQYNSFQQRIRKVNANKDVHYVYGLNGQLLGEYDVKNNTHVEYLYLNEKRLAIIKNGAIYYIHTNHLDAPMALSDTGGNTVWQASYDAFGNSQVKLDTVGGFNPRLPGQYEDSETGLYYNWHRYYNPRTGRYITSDPLGLYDGVNTYSYVQNNPVNKIDPRGLFDGKPTFGMPSHIQDQIWDLRRRQGQEGADFVYGTGSYFRGHYRNLRWMARHDGLFGKCQQKLVALESELLHRSLEASGKALYSSELLRGQLYSSAGEYADQNISRIAGRAFGNIAVNMSAGGTPVTGMALGGAAAHGDVRYLAERAVAAGVNLIPYEDILSQASLGDSNLIRRLQDALSECECNL